jgi:hypothetical protein
MFLMPLINRNLKGRKNIRALGDIPHPDQVNEWVAYLQTRKLHPRPYVTQALQPTPRLEKQ